MLCFNPRARVGRDLPRDPCHIFPLFRFNPRARVGRDGGAKVQTGYPSQVSIHAPAWGATYIRRDVSRPLEQVSIHAPAWGATSACAYTRRRLPVSIHAPAWGATNLDILRATGSDGFNPRARVGRDPFWISVRSLMECFNPRARVGRDKPGRRQLAAHIKFQSTRPRGARPTRYRVAYMTREVSIHAPAWGATRNGI